MVVGDGIRADLNRIGKTATQLAVLAGEFDRATSLAQAYAPALGSPVLAAALDAFTSNWAIHRRRLVDDLAREATLARAAVDAYRGTDDKLAAALARAEGSG
jgi:hypothetical protein